MSRGFSLRNVRRGALHALALGSAAIAALSLPPVPVAGQARTTTAKPTTAPKGWTAPRTAWGDPDLTGIWNNATSTPLQRRAADGKPILTDEEAAEFAADLAYDLTRDRRDGGAQAD